MKRYYYIFSAGKLKRKENTIFFFPFESQNADGPSNESENSELFEDLLLSIDSDFEQDVSTKRLVLPINDIDSFFIFANITFNRRFIDFCAYNGIPIHFFNYYGFYTGSFLPREELISGNLLVHQVRHYINKKLRIEIARKIIDGAIFNILKNLRYYNNRNRNLDLHIQQIEEISTELPQKNDIPDIMNIEGRIRRIYYSAFNEILCSEFEFDSRKFKPPSNHINSLISFSNSLVYTTVVSELYRTQLNPTISFLHEPGRKRFSLSLDIAEIFKPILADRMIFRLLNTKQITPKSFENHLEGFYLKEEARKTIVQEYDSRLRTVIKHRNLNREVSYRHIIRLECYKLIKHIIGDKEYEPFKIWW